MWIFITSHVQLKVFHVSTDLHSHEPLISTLSSPESISSIIFLAENTLDNEEESEKKSGDIHQKDEKQERNFVLN